MMRTALLFTLTTFGVLCPACAQAEEPIAQASEFFESQVRPILAEHCYSCHGPKKQQGGGLRLDSRSAMLKGGDGGAVLVPGSPEKSLLIKAVDYTGDLKMPPKQKLPVEAIANLRAWVKSGAPWPNDTGMKPASDPQAALEAARKHWAFQPVRPPAVPQPLALADWVRTPVDAFILARMQTQGLGPAPAADRRTLVRRVYFDLIGLPPTPEEMEAVLGDTAADWYPRLVERLLASPRYGERWARHWLDVARYADTKGYVFLEERKYPYSYTYRDYVIRAFNEDLPFDQFVLQQLAADQLPSADRRSLAAMGYLTLGRRFLNNIHDIIDDRIDVTMRGFLGLTVTCARCHDHKFDPLPTKDYYSLYGIFLNSIEPKDLPLIGEPEHNEAYQAYEKELQARERALNEMMQKRHAELLARLRTQVGDYLIAVREAERLPGEDHYEALNPGDLYPEMIRRWQAFLTQSKKKHDPIFAPWHALAALPKKDFAEKAKLLVEHFAKNADPAKPVHPLVVRLFMDRKPQTLQEVARGYGELFAKGLAPATDEEEKQRQSLRQFLEAPGAPPNPTLAEMEAQRLFDRAARDQLTGLKRKVDEWKANSAAAPPRAMVLNDASSPGPARVLLRGNPNNPGEQVPRQFLGILAGTERKPFTKGSGRLELAQAIASKDNPLTARVLVNRIWLHHFGQGLVRTPSDFGMRGEPPTHPELLDYLAATFVERGWSIKQLHRLIVLSNVYQQASVGDPRLATLDPENRLLARQNRRRLDFEQLRDALLLTAGRLDPKSGGPAVEITTQPFAQRRTIYGFIERQNLPGLFRTFDFASPDASTPQRFTTTVPQQALFLMNSPFVVEQARHLAQRTAALSDDQRVEELYRLCYGRKPDTDERELGQRFLATQAGGTKLAAVEKYAQVLLLANEFAFVD